MLTRREIAVEPQPGRLVMFESWLPHYVQCNKSDQVRISIAMNLREVPAAGRGTAGRRRRRRRLPSSEPQRAISAASAAAPRATSADAKPFLFEQVFEVRTDLKLNLEPIQNAIPTVVIDDFLKHPEEARDVVGRAPAANWKHEKGGKNFVDYYDCRLRFPIRLSEQHDCRRAAGHSPGL